MCEKGQMLPRPLLPDTYGMFAHTRLPYTLPIPKDILEYMYGENHEVPGVKG